MRLLSVQLLGPLKNYVRGTRMKQIDSFVMWLAVSVLILGGLMFSVYLLSFILPIVLLFLLGDFLWNLGRRWYYQKKFGQDTIVIVKEKSKGKHSEVIDAEYEILDDH